MSGQTFVLDNDICLNDISKYEKWKSVAPINSWTPIGTSDTHCFSGVFDGSGFSIEGLYVLGSKYQHSGLFGYTTNSCEISNVNMTYEYIDSTYTSDSYAGGITAYSNGKISNCTNSGVITSFSSKSNSYVGGIAGCSTSEINKCTNSGTMTSSSESYSYGGGIAGYSTATISDCTSSGSITSKSYSSYSFGGGIAGYSTATISDCTNSGSITSKSYSSYSFGGGIAGDSTAKISNCTNSGDISSSYYGGGIVGYSVAGISNCTNSGTIIPSSYSHSYVGGIVGNIYCSSDAKEIIISNVYNIGEINAKRYEGGIVGFIDSDNSSYKLTINNAYNIGKVSYAILGGSVYGKGFTIINSSYLIGQSEQGCTGYTDDEGIVAKSKEEMQTKEFAESLGDAFVYVEGDYPKLAWEVNGGEEPTEITSETISEDTSNIENTTDISETESISTDITDITESPSESKTTSVTTKAVNTSEITSKTYESLWVDPQHITLGFSGSQGRIHVFGGDGNYSFSSNGFFSVTQDGIVTSNSWLPSEGTITVRDGSGMSAEVSVTIWGETISTSTTPLTTTTNTTTTTSIITSTAETTPTTTTSSDVTTTSTTTTLPVTTMETSTMTTKNTTSTEVTKLSTTITTTTTEPLKAEIDSIEIEVGEKTTIKTNQDNLIFKTSNSDVAIVSKMGIITPVSAGTAIISVINSDGDSVQIKIEVKDSSLETTAIKTTEKITDATTTTTNKLTTEKTTSVTTTIVNPTTIVTTKPIIKISVGDVNGDGVIDSKDAVFVLKSYAETLAGNVATVSIEKGDVNGDDKIDSKDAVKILKYYASTMVGYKGNIVNFN